MHIDRSGTYETVIFESCKAAVSLFQSIQHSVCVHVRIGKQFVGVFKGVYFTTHFSELNQYQQNQVY